MPTLRKKSDVDLDNMDRNTFLLVMHGALWDLFEVLEESDGPYLRTYTNLRDVVPKIRKLMSLLEQCFEVPPATTAMSNDVILAEVLKHTDVTDLYHFRLVSRKWNYYSIQALSHRKSLKISIDAKVVENRVNTNFNGFPISVIELDVDKWNECFLNQAMPEFIQKYGPHVRTISLTGRKPQVQNYFVGLLNWLLNTCFSRVENLIFEWDFWDDSIEEPGWTLNYPRIVLPSLKHLNIKSSTIHDYLLLALIRSAVNLRTVQVSLALSSQVLTVLVAENKTELFKEYILSTDFVWESALLASNNPALECLEVRQYRPRIPVFFQSVAQILTSSRLTLTSLTVYAFNFISELNIDILPNLKHLHLYNNDNCGPISAVFPNGTILSIMFPRLESLVLVGLILQKAAMKIYFPSDTYESSHVNDPWGEVTDVQVDALMTVKVLELEDCSLSTFGLNALAKKFPNVISLKLASSEEFLQEDTLWNLRWSQLEYLELGGLVFGKLIMSSSLDSIFTGFSEETCKKLRGDPQEKDFLVDLEALTEYPSIRDLRNLQKLKLVFDILDQSENVGAVSNGEKSSASECSGFSWLTGRCAFEEMRNLRRVVIAYDKKQSNSADFVGAFESVALFGCVTVVQEPRKPSLKLD